MFGCMLNGLRTVPHRKSSALKLIATQMQQRLLSSNLSRNTVQVPGKDTNVRKPKTQPIPKITLISSDESISITTLEEAQKLSKRRDLKLVKIVDLDTKTQRPIYKLMTGTEYHAEDLKQRENLKKEKQNSTALKGEKLLMVASNIAENDLKVDIKKILKWISKRYEVRVVIGSDASNIEKAENVYKYLHDHLKNYTRFVQKRMKNNDIKFQIIPQKEENKSNNGS